MLMLGDKHGIAKQYDQKQRAAYYENNTNSYNGQGVHFSAHTFSVGPHVSFSRDIIVPI